MKKAIINVSVITPIQIIKHGLILIEDNTILEVCDDNGQFDLSEMEVIDGKGYYASPGFIDIHVHGGGGFDTTDGNPSEIVAMCEAHCKQGTTSIVPTTLAASKEVTHNAILAVKEAQKICKKANILGIHLEGPYFAASQRGAQSEKYIKNPNPKEYLELLDLWDKILIMAAAPELDGAMELGRELKKRNILASIAHSEATYDECLCAIENGYTDITHIYSGCSTVVRQNAYRVAGVVEAGLLRDELTVQMIADGKHLPTALLKLIYKCKGADKIALITDGLSLSAFPLQEGAQYTQKNGVKVVLEDGVIKLLDRQSFAGSVATSNRLVRNMVQMAEVPLVEAVKMATQTPARMVGVEKRKGILAKDYDADIILFDEEIQVKLVFVGGQLAFNNEE